MKKRTKLKILKSLQLPAKSESESEVRWLQSQNPQGAFTNVGMALVGFSCGRNSLYHYRSISSGDGGGTKRADSILAGSSVPIDILVDFLWASLFGCINSDR
jgi:hypothetical protein